MIELKGLRFGYDGQETIKGIDLTVKTGTFAAIIGPNGAGKSTVSRLIRGLLKPTDGAVLIDGQDTAKVKTSVLARKIGFLFQNPDRQICKNTVREELQFSLDYMVPDKTQHDRMIENTLAALELDGDANPLTLSRGERQRVALASVLVGEPEILLLDEPTTGLDYKECVQILDIIKGLNEKGVTVVMVTHDMEVALDYATELIIIADGQLMAQGSPGEIFYRADIMAEASVLPPQIIGLSQAMGVPFGPVTHVEDMAEAIFRRKQGDI